MGKFWREIGAAITWAPKHEKLHFSAAALISVSLNLVTSETQLQCLINQHLKVGMLKNRRLTKIAETDAVPTDESSSYDYDDKMIPFDDESEEEHYIIQFDPNTPGSMERRCTRTYDLLQEKHLCNDLLGSEMGKQMLENVRLAKYVVKFGCAVGRNNQSVKACCARRTSKKKQGNIIA